MARITFKAESDAGPAELVGHLVALSRPHALSRGHKQPGLVVLAQGLLPVAAAPRQRHRRRGDPSVVAEQEVAGRTACLRRSGRQRQRCPCCC